jgi:hypothetical protein
VSRFGEILKNAKRGAAPEEAPADPAPTSDRKAERSPPPESPPAEVPSPAPRQGRPPGKRSDPAYEQVTAYIPKALYRDVRIRLLQEGQDQEFSELVAELLSAWLDRRPRG